MRGDIGQLLRGERAVVHEGVLHLDREAARSKMSAYTLPSPYFWVLQIVRVACFSGATRIELDVTVRSVEIRFDAALDPAMLEDIWNVALDPRVTRDRQAIRYLALGVAAARTLGPASLTVRTGNVELQCAGEEEQLLPCDTAVSGTVISCVEKFRLAHVTDYFRELFSQPAEIDALKKFAYLATLDVVANGELITSTGVPFNTSYGEVRVHNFGDGIEVCATVGGVLVHREQALIPTMRSPIGDWTLALESSALELDLSTMSLRGRTRDLDRVIAAQLWRYFMQEPARIERLTPLERIALFAVALRDDNSDEARDLVKLLFAYPMFPSMFGSAVGEQIVSLQDTVVDGAYCYVTEPVATAGVVALIEDYEIFLLLGIRGYLGHDVTDDARALGVREANIARWERQPPVAFEGLLVERDGFRGSIELTALQAGLIRFCKEGRVVQELPMSVPVMVQIDGPLKFNLTFDEVAHTRKSEAFTVEVLRKLPQLYPHADDNVARELIDLIAWDRLEYQLASGAAVDYFEFAPEGEAPFPQSWLRRLSHLAERRLIDTSRDLKSIEELFSAELTPVIGPAESTDRIVLDDDDPLTMSLMQMWPELAESTPHSPRVNPRVRFESQPTYTATLDEDAFNYEVQLGATKVLLTMRDETEPYRARVTLVYQGRRLTRHHWDSRHASWDAVVWCDELTPASDMHNVMHDDAYHAMKEAFFTAESRAIRLWRRGGKRAATSPPAEREVSEPEVTEPEVTEPVRFGELQRVAALLQQARGARRELVGDFMLNRLALRRDDGAWNAQSEGVSIGATHPIAALRHSDDPIEQAFLASGAATAINAYYRSFSDTQELYLQASLLTTASSEARFNRADDGR